ncbi:sugar phosphate isomerase/epimerase family protein [Desertivirga arenae]|uniref:sugar phosphate isomerase/epimerase family protein n=1 Tax=Desertivirga arenae TaxID=2810309 RepID=UPI001A97603A|nr:sugar phosphate isomerase/epimerase [Pedobacter sp. SYSU D00823]
MINRRTFISGAIAAGLGLALSPALIASTKKSKAAGLQLYTLRDLLKGDVREVISQVAKAGFKEVEVFGYNKQNGFWGLQPQELKGLLKQHRLSSPSGHYDLGRYIKSGKIEDLDETISVAKLMGHRYITIPYLAEDLRKTAENVKDLVSNINNAAIYIRDKGLKLAYHNHDFEFNTIGGKLLYQSLLEGTKPGLVDFEMDLYWVIRAGQDPLKWFRQYPGRFKMVHVKDMSKDNPKLNTEVGSGSIDFKHIFTEARLAGIDHYILEQENFDIDAYESIKRSCQYFLSNLATI